jgi:hypothetical protein
MKFLMGTIVLATLIGCSPSARQPPAADTPAIAEAPAQDSLQASAVQNANSAAATSWQYHEDTDSGSGEKSRYATIKSRNTIEFGFPYAGAQRATLRYQPRIHSPTIRLIIEHGQILCRSNSDGSNGCFVPVKFDNGALDIWRAQVLSDGSTNTLDFGTIDDNPKSPAICVADQLTKTKTLAIRATFYYEGDRTIEFNVAGLGDLPLPALTKNQLDDCRAKRAH